MSQSAHLITFGAGLQQTLLYGELQQVLLLLPHAVSLFAPQHGVSRRGLKHTWGNLSCSTRHCSTQGEGKGQETGRLSNSGGDYTKGEEQEREYRSEKKKQIQIQVVSGLFFFYVIAAKIFPLINNGVHFCKISSRISREVPSEWPHNKLCLPSAWLQI